MKKLSLAAATATLALLALPAVAQAPERGRAQSMTLADMQNRVQTRFARTDANRDGFLTRAEVQAQPGVPGREERLARREQREAKRAQRLSRLDTNRDGTISQAERQERAAARNVDPGRREARQAQRQERRAERQAAREARGLRINERRFARLDSDRDGRLSLAEVSARLATRFQRLDANDDGSVSREERRAGRALRQSRRNG
jgi:Ca2+-binding EF-hand superfamily protein